MCGFRSFESTTDFVQNVLIIGCNIFYQVLVNCLSYFCILNMFHEVLKLILTFGTTHVKVLCKDI